MTPPAIPRHRHLGNEQIFVLEGSVGDDTGTGTAGHDARRPLGGDHTVTGRNGALVMAILSGGTEPPGAHDARGPASTPARVGG